MVLSGGWCRRFVGALTVLVVIWGGVLRLNNLDQKSLWADELFTLAIAHYQPLIPKAGQSLYRQIQVGYIGDNDSFLTAKAAEQSPPLYDLLVKATLNLPVNMELSSRLPAALMSCLLLLWFAAFAWRHPDARVRRVLRWTTVLVALHPALVLYAQEGRAYGLGASLVGMGGLLWALRWRKGWREWQPPGWIEISLFTLACYSHYNAALLVAMLLLPDAVMATKARSVKGWIRLLALGAVFSIWLALNAHAILFTAQGGVGWIAPSLIDSYAHVGDNVMAALHPQWLAFTLGLGVCLLVIRWHQNKLCWWGEDAWQLWVLATLCILYLVFAALIVSRAGMEHPRYFVFIVPFVLVLMGLILAELHHKGLAVGAIFTIMILAQPNATLIAREGNDDFRSMGWAASDGSNDKTYFLYPWEPNRNLYRLYLQRFLGYDPIANMISVSSKEQAAQVCEKITGLSHVVALGHAVSHAVIDTVYAQCGENWPMREQKDFHQTFSEHWR
jgi:hypothetical protein